jgi:hypothetical protein
MDKAEQQLAKTLKKEIPQKEVSSFVNKTEDQL